MVEQGEISLLKLRKKNNENENDGKCKSRSNLVRILKK